MKPFQLTAILSSLALALGASVALNLVELNRIERLAAATERLGKEIRDARAENADLMKQIDEDLATLQDQIDELQDDDWDDDPPIPPPSAS